MPTTWVLVFALNLTGYNGGNVVAFQEFSDRERCESVRDGLAQLWNRDIYGARIIIQCVPK